MRKLLYSLGLVMLILAVLFQARRLRKLDEQDIISIQSEWDRHGYPIDVEVIQKASLIFHTNVSGTVQDSRTITAQIPKEIKLKLHAGQRFTSCKKGITIQGSVYSVDQTPQMLTGLYRVSFKTKKDLDFTPGTIIVCCVETDAMYNIVRIPFTAVFRENGDTFCWVVNENTVTKRVISIGKANDTHYEVIKGIKQGEMVVTDGARMLQEGQTVRIRHTEGDTR